jgi:hypothetical protein
MLIAGDLGLVEEGRDSFKSLLGGLF